jgi:DUF4097 and DUF4098 domain-containing protein YvlB
MLRPDVAGVRALVVAGIVALAPACSSSSDSDDGSTKVLGSVRIPAGQHGDNATTVNGSIDIGADAVIKNADTVNGSITVHPRATVASLETVNGSVRVGQGVHVGGGVSLVNGSVTLDDAVDVAGKVANVNGDIKLSAAHVGGGIETRTGDISVGPGSRVEGGILMRKSEHSWFSFGAPRVPRVVIGAGAVVAGPLHFEREVKLYVSDQATIGPVEGATAVKFTGAQPPG